MTDNSRLQPRNVILVLVLCMVGLVVIMQITSSNAGPREPKTRQPVATQHHAHQQPGEPRVVIDTSTKRAIGFVVTRENQPIVGAEVYLTPSATWKTEHAELLERGVLVRTGADGAYILAPEGEFAWSDSQLNVRAKGYMPRSFRPGMWSADRYVVVLDRGHRMYGRVVDLNGESVPEAVVSIRGRFVDESVSAGSYASGAGLPVFETTADAHGVFAVWGCAYDSRYLVSARKGGHMAAPPRKGKRPSRPGPHDAGEAAFEVLDCPLEIRLQPLYLAVVGARFCDRDLMGYCDALLFSQNLEWPPGYQPKWEVRSRELRSLPVEVQATLARITNSTKHSIRILAARPFEGERSPADGQIVVRLKKKQVGSFSVEGEAQIVLRRCDSPHLGVQFIELSTSREIRFGRIRVRRADGQRWPRARMPLAVRTDLDGRTLTLVGDVDESGRYIESPPIPEGAARVWVPDHPDAKVHVEVNVVAGSTAECAIEYEAPPLPIIVRVEYGSGLSAGPVDLAVMEGERRRFRRYRRDSRGTGRERVPRAAFLHADRLALLVRRPGFPWTTRVLDAEAIQGILKSGTVTVQLGSLK